MNLLKIHESVRRAIDLIHSGTAPKDCVPDEWKLESNRDKIDEAYHDVCMNLWLHMGDTALNRSGYTNSLSIFWNEIIGKKDDKNKTSSVEHWDESWYF